MASMLSGMERFAEHNTQPGTLSTLREHVLCRMRLQSVRLQVCQRVARTGCMCMHWAWLTKAQTAGVLAERQNRLHVHAQGMADLDPDVDAIYRLTQKLGVNFETDVASVALPEGVMCPWNSQNTLFEREALWGMLIPVTTTFRVCDIWRSYWVQVRSPAFPSMRRE